jgi:hypothetical protein
MTRTRNINFFHTFIRREIVGHDENWPTRVRATTGIVWLETICPQINTNTPSPLANSGLKWSRAYQASPLARCDIITESSLLCFPSLCHLFYFILSLNRNNHLSLGVRYVTELCDHHFCGNKDCIFVYYLHVSRPFAMHTFVVVLVLLLEQHVILFLHINLLVVHTEMG